VPTLLVTKNMSPALAARVQAAVSGHRTGAARRAPLKALLRLFTFIFLIASIASVLHFRRQQALERENRRGALLQTIATEAGKLSRKDRELPRSIAAAIALETAANYAGDTIAEDLRSRASLDETLSHPIVYMRAPRESLAQPARLAELAESSAKDAFVLCLLAPPDARSEKALRAKASTASAQGKGMQATAHVERLAPLLQVMPLLERGWAERVQGTESIPALHQLQNLLEAAPFPAAVRAAKARQLLLVADETLSATGPTELDGERTHAVRVVLTDLNDGEIRLRLRRTVDPSWLSEATRAQFASGADSCALAMDIRQAAVTVP
jgi:hypothetical protein